MVVLVSIVLSPENEQVSGGKDGERRWCPPKAWLHLDCQLIGPIGFENHHGTSDLVGKDKLIQLAARAEGKITDTVQSEFRICAGLEKDRAFTLGVDLTTPDTPKRSL